jgi:hypothetical protein
MRRISGVQGSSGRYYFRRFLLEHAERGLMQALLPFQNLHCLARAADLHLHQLVHDLVC